MTLPSTPGYRRLVDSRARQKQLEDRQHKREALVRTFDPRERNAVDYLSWMRKQIYENYQKHYERVHGKRNLVVVDTNRPIDVVYRSVLESLVVEKMKNYYKGVY